jgi:peroxiredoxin
MLTTGQYTKRNEETMGLLALGAQAPDFSLLSTPGQKVSLSEFRGKRVVLVFYPADWSPVCGDQFALYNEVLPVITKYGAEVLGVSADGIWCHLAFSKERKLRFPDWGYGPFMTAREELPEEKKTADETGGWSRSAWKSAWEEGVGSEQTDDGVE